MVSPVVVRNSYRTDEDHLKTALWYPYSGVAADVWLTATIIVSAWVCSLHNAHDAVRAQLTCLATGRRVGVAGAARLVAVAGAAVAAAGVAAHAAAAIAGQAQAPCRVPRWTPAKQSMADDDAAETAHQLSEQPEVYTKQVHAACCTLA
jgi:hypothetical protein